MKIHPLAIVSPQADLGDNVIIGPFAIVEADTVLGEGCEIGARASVKNGVRLGPNNIVCEGTVLGGLPQHTRCPAQVGSLIVGTGNVFRENVTVHRALKVEASTVVGDNNLLMVGAHVAHDCQLGSNVVFANNSLLAGHVHVQDRAFVSGAVAVHQFCRLGSLAMIGGHARVVQDVPPYVTIDGVSGCVVGLNMVGLRRNGFSTADITELKAAYRLIYRGGMKWADVLAHLKSDFPTGPAAVYYEFLSAGTRGFVQERRVPPQVTLKIRRQVEEEPAAAEAKPDLKSKAG